jgi:hypothetical protein
MGESALHCAVDSLVAATSLRDPHTLTGNRWKDRISLNRKYLVTGSSGQKLLTALGTGGSVFIFRDLRS